MPISPTPSDLEARTQRHLAVLDTLIAQGMDLATRLHEQSTTPSDLCSALAAPGVAIPFITPDVIAAFAQINQTIRRAILVSRKLTEPLAAPPPNAGRKRTAREIEDNRRCPETNQAETNQAETNQAENIGAEFAERLYSPDLEDRIGTRPIPEIIASLCRDLDIDVDMDIKSGAADPLAPEEAEPLTAWDTQDLGPGATSDPPPPPRPLTEPRTERPDHDPGIVATILPLHKPEPRPPKPRPPKPQPPNPDDHLPRPGHRTSA